MTEPVMMSLLVAGPACWTLGGYRWKVLRRFAWPALVGAALVASGRAWPGLLAIPVLVAVNVLPYGDRKPIAWNALVFSLYALPAVFLEPRVALLGSLVLGALLTGLYALSRRVNRVSWKVWEATAGLLQTAVVLIAAQ